MVDRRIQGGRSKLTQIFDECKGKFATEARVLERVCKLGDEEILDIGYLDI